MIPSSLQCRHLCAEEYGLTTDNLCHILTVMTKQDIKISMDTAARANIDLYTDLYIILYTTYCILTYILVYTD